MFSSHSEKTWALVLFVASAVTVFPSNIWPSPWMLTSTIKNLTQSLNGVSLLEMAVL